MWWRASFAWHHKVRIVHFVFEAFCNDGMMLIEISRRRICCRWWTATIRCSMQNLLCDIALTEFARTLIIAQFIFHSQIFFDQRKTIISDRNYVALHHHTLLSLSAIPPFSAFRMCFGHATCLPLEPKQESLRIWASSREQHLSAWLECQSSDVDVSE